METDDLKALKQFLDVKLWNEDYGYIKLAKHGGLLPRTLIDLAVFSPERLIYEAAPLLGPGLSKRLNPWQTGKGTPLACDLVVTEDEIKEYEERVEQAKADPNVQARSRKLRDDWILQQAQQMAKKTGIPLEIAKQKVETTYHQEEGVNYLDPDFVLHVKGESMTFSELARRKDLDRTSLPDPIEGVEYGRSTATFFYNDGRTPCIHSFAHGGRVYRIRTSNDAVSELEQAEKHIESIFPLLEQDSSVAYTEDTLEALKIIRTNNPSKYEFLRTKFKNTNKDVSVTKLDKLTTKNPAYDTHHAYATELLNSYVVNSWDPVSFEESLFTLDLADSVWKMVPFEDLVKKVTNEFDGKPNCKRRNDYQDIARHAVSIVKKPQFFSDAPVGIACQNRFYQIRDNEITEEPLSPEHRQRIRLDYNLESTKIPLFHSFLEDTFSREDQEEQQQQIAVVQEIFGGILLGILHRLQKAIIFFDPIGRAGKGTTVDILKSLLPPQFITTISPYEFDHEYYRAALLNSRLNVVGELERSKQIQAATLKMVTGGDEISGRHPTGRPFHFKCEAAHLFMSNYMIKTTDRSDAFFSRWQFVEFPNSRLQGSLPLDPDLAKKIIAKERPGIAYWALQGGKRLLMANSFTCSKAHDRLMLRWRGEADSLWYFIQEECETGDPSFRVKQSDFNAEYESWCAEGELIPEKKLQRKKRLTQFPRLHIGSIKSSGHDYYTGIRLKDQQKFT